MKIKYIKSYFCNECDYCFDVGVPVKELPVLCCPICTSDNFVELDYCDSLEEITIEDD